MLHKSYTMNMFQALKILHNSSEFMPYVIFIAAPGVEVMKSVYDYSRGTGYSSRTLTVSTTCTNSFVHLFLKNNHY